MLTIKVLEDLGYEYHHTALSRGYQKKGTLSFEKYNGRFGKGYKVFTHNPNSTQYKIVYYYIKKED